MANKAFSELPNVASATLSDIICAVQGGVNYQVSQSQVLDLFRDNIVINYAGDPNGNVGGKVYQLCADTTNNTLYICTTTGNAATAVWTVFGFNLATPQYGGTGLVNPSANDVVITNGTSTYNTLTLSDGQLLIGSSGNIPSVSTLTAGTNINITNGAGNITISAAVPGLVTWSEVTGTSQAMTPESAYIANNASLVTLTLPATAAVGELVTVVGKGAGGWSIAQNAGQQIHVGSASTTVGVGGSLASTHRYDSIDLVCVTADTEWVTRGGPQGNITIV